MSGDQPAKKPNARVRDLLGAVEYHRTISDADVLAFAAATGDDNRVHMDAVYAAEMGMGGRVAHGILVQGLMSTACTRWAERAGLRILSYGWDRVRFIRPVLVGDTITTAYALEDPADTGRKRRARPTPGTTGASSSGSARTSCTSSTDRGPALSTASLPRALSCDGKAPG